ncbi:hypothetical protein [Streptomyces sp. NPDC054765]
MHEQGKAAAWCGRLLLFTALISGLTTVPASGHPMTGHGGHDTRTSAAPAAVRPAAPPRQPADTARARPSRARADAPGGAIAPGTVCRAVLSVRALVLLVLLGAGPLTGRRETGLLTVLRARLLRGLWPIPRPPRHELPARLSVLRV